MSELTHTPGYVSMGKWNAAEAEALIYFGCPEPNATDAWAFASWLGFRNEADAREFVKRWNCHDELLAACKLALGRIESDIESTGRTVIEGEALRVAIARAESR